MKIVKIFVVVIAVHGIAFLLIFLNPGCSTASKPTPVPTDTTAAVPVANTTYSTPGASDPVAQPAAMSSSDLNPPVAAPSNANSSSAPTISFNMPSVPGARAAPTRPGTAAAASLQTQPVESMPVTTYKVSKGDSLWSLAKKNGISVNDLAKANNLSSTTNLKLGQKLIIPGKPMVAKEETIAASDATPVATYKVRAGDILQGIAKKTGTTAAAIKSANKLKSDVVRAGQELKLPAGTVAAPASDATPSAAATTANTDKTNASGALTHTVKTGETLGAIARKYQVTVGELATKNNIADPAKLKAGQELIIPGFNAIGRKPAATATSETTATPKAASEPVAAPENLEPTVRTQTTNDAPVIKVEDNNNTPPKS